MSMTEEQIHAKVAKLFDDNELTIRASRVVVPTDHLDQFVIDPIDQMHVILNAKAFRLQIPSNVAKGVRNSLQTAESDKQKICLKYDLTNYCKSSNLKEICRFAKRQIGLSEIFDQFMDVRKDAFKTAAEFRSMIEYFFKYMPFVTIQKYCEFTTNDFATELIQKISIIHDKLEMIAVDYSK